jgi:FKBP-type peptidyl-prolyl cis-trans isomerase FkpA
MPCYHRLTDFFSKDSNMMRRSLYLLMICACAASMAQAAGQSAAKPAAKTKIQASAAAAATAAAAAAEAASAAAVAASAAQSAVAAESAAAEASAPTTLTVPSAPGLDPLVITDTVVGKGKTAGQGSKVFMHYTGWLYKTMAPRQRGRKFDSSHDRGEPLDFTLGTGRVIKGWDQGIMGMKVGGKRTLIIPSHLAYGSRGAGDMIGPGADLIFDVELMEVK